MAVEVGEPGHAPEGGHAEGVHGADAIAKLRKNLSHECADVATELVVIEVRRAGYDAPGTTPRWELLAGVERLVEQLERSYANFLDTARREYSELDAAGGLVEGNPRAMEALAYYFSGHMARNAAGAIRSALDGSITGYDVVDRHPGRSDA